MTADELREKLSYCSKTGFLTWKIRPANRVKIGDRAGSLGANGYRVIQVSGQPIKEHRAIWAIQTGEWPPKGYQIDHINGIKHDNRWCNLRLATPVQNLIGRKMRNVTGFAGVNKAGNRYQAAVSHNHKKIYLGRFDTPEEAHQAYLNKISELHGKEFALIPESAK